MPDLDPLNSSAGDRLRPREIPPAVRRTIALMVRGRDDDELCTPLDLVTASREAGIKPHLFRKYLDRPEVRALLLRERKIFRDAICASNEAALQRVRDKSPNGMATVAAVRALEDLTDEAAVRDGRSAPHQTCGVVIKILAASPAPAAPASNIIDLTPERSAQVSTTDFGDDGDVIPPSFPGPGPIIGEPPPAPPRNDPMRLLPSSTPLRRRGP